MTVVCRFISVPLQIAAPPVHNGAVVEHIRRLAQRLGTAGMLAIALGGLALTLVLTAAAMAAVVWMPADHFSRPPGQDALALSHPVVRWTVKILKNVAGLLIVPLGVVLALPGVPGPGLVFILIGLSLLDFPGKRRLERRLLGFPAVLHFLNRARARFGRPPLVI
jgi:hypothetical protein